MEIPFLENAKYLIGAKVEDVYEVAKEVTGIDPKYEEKRNKFGDKFGKMMHFVGGILNYELEPLNKEGLDFNDEYELKVCKVKFGPKLKKYRMDAQNKITALEENIEDILLEESKFFKKSTNMIVLIMEEHSNKILDILIPDKNKEKKYYDLLSRTFDKMLEMKRRNITYRNIPDETNDRTLINIKNDEGNTINFCDQMLDNFFLSYIFEGKPFNSIELQDIYREIIDSVDIERSFLIEIISWCWEKCDKKEDIRKAMKNKIINQIKNVDDKENLEKIELYLKSLLEE